MAKKKDDWKQQEKDRRMMLKIISERGEVSVPELLEVKALSHLENSMLHNRLQRLVDKDVLDSRSTNTVTYYFKKKKWSDDIVQKAFRLPWCPLDPRSRRAVA